MFYIKCTEAMLNPILVSIALCGGKSNKNKIDNLQKVQNRATRLITNSEYDVSVAPLIRSLGWTMISNLIQKETA